MRKLVTRKCIACGNPFQAQVADVKRGYGLFCSRSCKNRGKHNPRWKGGISGNHYHYKKLQKSRYPEKLAARNLLRHAIKSGKITRQPCSVCGDPKSFAHHPDYSAPLKVKWLCRRHHREVHANRASITHPS